MIICDSILHGLSTLGVRSLSLHVLLMCGNIWYCAGLHKVLCWILISVALLLVQYPTCWWVATSGFVMSLDVRERHQVLLSV